MKWKYFFAISAYILTACDPVSSANGITNVMLADGLTPNEGRVVYDRSGIVGMSACGDGLFSQEASIVCRQLGYKGVNNVFVQSPFGQSTSIDQQRLHCDGDEETLADCTLLLTTFCSDAGGVICYENGYIGCYLSVLGELQTPCENGVQDLTIPKCVSLCHHTNDIYTYAGLNEGNMCYCWSASATISNTDKVDDNLCSSPCAGRDIEKCGGDTLIALFNITLYLQNTNRIASPSGCAEPTPTQAEGLTTTVHAVSETNNPTQSIITKFSTNIYSTLSSETSNQSEKCTCPPKPECSASKAVQIGLIVVVIALLLYAVAITIWHIQLRHKIPTRTGENGPDPYMDLQPRPETDRTYQDMAISSTASSKTPGERRLPSPNLVYENQNVAQYANKIKEGADYEDVLTPN